MRSVRYTLLSDGSSDRALTYILTWLLRQYLPGWAIQPAWADLSRVPRWPMTLPERIRWSIELYPCDLLFVHRDAEREPRSSRVDEIHHAVAELTPSAMLPPIVCVIPVRMLEAWLLADEAAIRTAAGNPNGRHSLDLPRLREVESLPDPKNVLNSLLLEASGLHGRRRRGFRVNAIRVAQLTDDFSPLRQLPAFQALEAELVHTIGQQGWYSQV